MQRLWKCSVNSTSFFFFFFNCRDVSAERISDNFSVYPCSKVQKWCEQKSLGGPCEVSCRGFPGEGWGGVMGCYQAHKCSLCMGREAEHRERTTVSSGLCRWLLAWDHKTGAARDRREMEAKGRGAKVVLEPDSHGSWDEAVRSRHEWNLKVGEPALMWEEWFSLASSWIWVE